MNYAEIFKKYALAVPEVLLPGDRINLSRWAVIACDQYTQDRSYWKRVAENAGKDPSTLNIIFPEVFLEDDGRKELLSSIRSTMKKYLDSSVFAEAMKGFVYIERKTAYGRTRKGLVVTVDLDSYEWKTGSKALIRATEATIVDRIPPRMEIRRGAPLESPHIMLLVNDPGKTLVEAAGRRVRENKPLYDTPLLPDAGSITGWAVSQDSDLESVASAVEGLAAANTATDGSCFLFAVGDGNHSLATAKAVWDEFKAAQLATQRASNQGDATEGAINLENHPARYALVEIVNLYDEGLTFEPIHRVLFGTNASEVSSFLAKKLGGAVSSVASHDELTRLVEAKNETRFGFVAAGSLFCLDTPDAALAVSRLQPALDEFLASRPDVKIDFIHGTEEVFRLGAEPGAVSILLPPVEKDSFFTTIGSGGPLPRKSFSMGEASEKRYYMECRKLFG